MDKKTNKEKIKGFTLIELLVTIAIIALVAVITITFANNIIKTGKTSANKVTYKNIESASLEYVKEFKTTNDYWYEEKDENGNLTGNDFTCTTIQQLINKGYLKNNLVDAETGEKIPNNTTIKVTRDLNKVIDSNIKENKEECDRTKPEVEIKVTGPNKDNWYYDKEDEKTKIEINPISKGIVEIKEYVYTITDKDSNYSFEVTDMNNKTFNLSEKIDKTKYGKDTKICVTVVNKNDIYSDEQCITINVDFTTPTKPTLKASDSIASNKWHTAKFDLNVTGGGTSPSGKIYIYGTTEEEVNINVSNNKISVIGNTNGTTYYVKACNKVGVCSSNASYIAKVDTTTPTKPTLKASDSIATNKWHKSTFDLNVSGGGTSPSGIIYKYGTSSTKVTTSVSNKKIAVGETTKTTYYVKACTNAGKCSENVSYIAKVDTTTPTKPTLTASDSIASNKWHKSTFDLNISGGGSAPSGIIYKYGTSSTNVNTTVADKKIAIESTDKTTYYVKTCTNAGKCSSNASYISKIDTSPPYISGYSKEDYNTTLIVNAHDSDSGIVKYKITQESKYVNSGWTTITATTEDIEIKKTITSNGTYYAWVQDVAGNYKSKKISMTNVAKIHTFTVTGSTKRISYTEEMSNVDTILSVKTDQGSVTTYYYEEISNAYLWQETYGELSLTVTGGTPYEKIISNSPEITAAQAECLKYRCKYGGRLSGDRCVSNTEEELEEALDYLVNYGNVTSFKITSGRTYTISTHYDVRYSCTEGKSVDGSGNQSTDCEEGYSFVNDDTYYHENTCEDDCKKSSKNIIDCDTYGRKTCKWDGNYDASCTKRAEEKTCPSNKTQIGEKCYSCEPWDGTFNKTTKTCDKPQNMWDYNITVIYR